MTCLAVKPFTLIMNESVISLKDPWLKKDTNRFLSSSRVKNLNNHWWLKALSSSLDQTFTILPHPLIFSRFLRFNFLLSLGSCTKHKRLYVDYMDTGTKIYETWSFSLIDNKTKNDCFYYFLFRIIRLQSSYL